MTAPQPARKDEKLGILLAGFGAVASTFAAGILHAQKSQTPLVGSLTQLGKVSVPTNKGTVDMAMGDLVSLASVDNLSLIHI